MRRPIHGGGQEPLWLCYPAHQGHLQQRQDHDPAAHRGARAGRAEGQADGAGEFVRAFQEEINAAAEATAARAEQLTREAEVVERKIAGIVAAIEDGMYTPVLKERMKVLEARKAEIQGLLANARRPSVVRLHPNAAEIYRRKVADLELALNDDSIKAEAGEILRSLIDRVVLMPATDAPDGIDAQLHGELAAVLALSGAQNQKLPAAGAVGSQLSVVAGARNHLYRTAVRWP